MRCSKIKHVTKKVWSNNLSKFQKNYLIKKKRWNKNQSVFPIDHSFLLFAIKTASPKRFRLQHVITSCAYLIEKDIEYKILKTLSVIWPFSDDFFCSLVEQNLSLIRTDWHLWFHFRSFPFLLYFSLFSLLDLFYLIGYLHKHLPCNS